jgi:hypothetical protein
MMANSSLVKKLRLQAGQKALILNPPVHYIDDLGKLPEDVQLSLEPGGKFDFVHLFASQSSELTRLKTIAVETVEPDGLLWVSYPKRSSKIDSDLSRDDMWELYIDQSLRPVSQISIDETWSAVRFRPTDKVGK